MSRVFLTIDRANYRRWVNIIPSIILPGSAHYLSNRKLAGVIWFVGYVAYASLKIFLYSSPDPRIHPMSDNFRFAIDCAFVVCLCVDACRRPMPRFGFKGWVSVFVVAVAILLVPFLLVRQFLLQPFYIPTGG